MPSSPEPAETSTRASSPAAQGAEALASGAKQSTRPPAARKYHIVSTAGLGSYMEWQSRVHYFWFFKAREACEAELGGGCPMGGYTRLLHSGKADDWVDEIPTVIVPPAPAQFEKILQRFPVLHRSFALKDWLETHFIPGGAVLLTSSVAGGRPAYMIHYTYGQLCHVPGSTPGGGTWNNGSAPTAAAWRFDKRDYMTKFPTPKYPMPPKGCEHEVVEELIRRLNTAADNLPRWRELAGPLPREMQPQA
ncbi:hypothetical protein ABPG77_002106 [Micractinium sp. CCAP 211/92]